MSHSTSTSPMRRRGLDGLLVDLARVERLLRDDPHQQLVRRVLADDRPVDVGLALA